MLGDEIVINAIDREEENHGNAPYHLCTTTLPSQLVIKLNISVEIYVGNYDLKNGLINDADGIIKSYNKTYKVDVLWINLYDPKIGHHQNNKLTSLYRLHISQD